MEKVFTPGRMAEDMKENISMIRNTAKAFTPGPMEEDMKALGHMENNMEEENTFCLKEPSELVFGIMERGLNGLMRRAMEALVHPKNIMLQDHHSSRVPLHPEALITTMPIEMIEMNKLFKLAVIT